VLQRFWYAIFFTQRLGALHDTQGKTLHLVGELGFIKDNATEAETVKLVAHIVEKPE